MSFKFLRDRTNQKPKIGIWGKVKKDKDRDGETMWDESKFLTPKAKPETAANVTGQQVSTHTTTGAVQVLDILIKKRISKAQKKKKKKYKPQKQNRKKSLLHSQQMVGECNVVCERESEIKVLSVCQISDNFSAFFFIFLWSSLQCQKYI